MRPTPAAVRRDLKYQPQPACGGECQGVYYPRLVRDGWTYIENIQIDQWKSKDIFEKALPHGWILRKIAHGEIGAPVGKGVYWDEHELVCQKSMAVTPCPTWEWAELDAKRLVWAENGKIIAAKVTAAGLTDVKELFDFTEMEFTAIAAPY
jgi:hypothetical protein